MAEPFEASSSWAYRFARYTALPEILTYPEVIAGEPFRLVALTQRALDSHLSQQQQRTTFLRARNGQPLAIASSVKFYVPFIAAETGQLINLGKGMFRLPTAEDLDEDDVEDAALDAGEEEAGEFDGWIYAFTFPALQRDAVPYPIKIGKTSGDVDVRVATQCRASASFDNPTIVGRWQVRRVGAMEQAVHSVLKARGKWRENVPGTEWFDVRPEEIATILRFVQGDQ